MDVSLQCPRTRNISSLEQNLLRADLTRLFTIGYMEFRLSQQGPTRNTHRKYHPLSVQ